MSQLAVGLVYKAVREFLDPIPGIWVGECGLDRPNLLVLVLLHTEDVDYWRMSEVKDRVESIARDTMDGGQGHGKPIYLSVLVGTPEFVTQEDLIELHRLTTTTGA